MDQTKRRDEKSIYASLSVILAIVQAMHLIFERNSLIASSSLPPPLKDASCRDSTCGLKTEIRGPALRSSFKLHENIVTEYFEGCASSIPQCTSSDIV